MVLRKVTLVGFKIGMKIIVEIKVKFEIAPHLSTVHMTSNFGALAINLGIYVPTPLHSREEPLIAGC